jgi:hypothetical protein
MEAYEELRRLDRSERHNGDSVRPFLSWCNRGMAKF